MMKVSRHLGHLAVLPLCGLCFFIGALTVEASTYYVETTGNNSNAGTSISPFLTIQKCIDVMKAGDTCLVGSGTYTDTDNNGIVGYVGAMSASGFADAPITIKSKTLFGAKVLVPSIGAIGNRAFSITKPYYIIEGFDITGNGATSVPDRTSLVGIAIASSATGTVVRQNKIHHIGRTVCSISTLGFAGVWVSSTSGVIIDSNLLYSIGRLRVGESGCGASVALDANDHGIYAETTTNLIVGRNVFYDTDRGWPIHVFKSGGGTTTNLAIYNNTFGHRTSTTYPPGQIVLTSTVTNAIIKNNISYDAYQGLVHCSNMTTSSTVTVAHILTDTQVKTTASCPSGVSFSNYFISTSLGFVKQDSNDFRLASGSPAIDRGSQVGFPFSGLAPDIGAFEFSAGLKPPANLQVR
jgi:hypothetical protein